MKIKKVHGVGINDMPNYLKTNLKLYSRWGAMFRRAYSPELHQKHTSYIGTSVCEEWQTLSNFVAWAEAQGWEGKELDKDILCPGNKIYSPETCVFVSHELNNLLCGSDAIRGDCPKGVYYHYNHKRYCTEMYAYGKKRILGYYLTIPEAHRAYCEAKSAHIREVAENLTDADTTDIERTREGLLEHAEIEGNRWRVSEGVADSGG
jgi:hypothetical protein